LEKEDLIMDEMKIGMPLSELVAMLDVINFYASGQQDNGEMARCFMDKPTPVGVSEQLGGIIDSLSESFQITK
jgi:hypothetical protein